jgi:8-oxo-dGTP pyrophosphatase MutT (NUDIX family)
VIDDSWYVRPEGVTDRTSAGGIVVRRGDGGRIWVALTSEGLGAHVLPKGGVEAGESLEQAARREIQEEAGLTDLTLLGSLGARSRLNWNKKRWITTHYFLFATRQEHGTPTDPNRLYRLTWGDLDDLPAIYWPEQRALIEENRAAIRRLLEDFPP